MAGDPRFETTKWSMVLAASRAREEAGSGEALEALCRAYWHPVFAFIRRSGRSEDDALDVTQDFFSSLIESGVLAAADPDRGRFRSFLLSMVKQHLSHARVRDRALKRGGGVRFVSMETARRTASIDPSDSPERVFERQWALTALDRARRALESELAAAGKEQQYQLLSCYLTGGGDERPYAETARELDTSEPAVKMAVHRLRQRFGRLLREEIAQTVATEAEIDSEVRDLLQAL